MLAFEIMNNDQKWIQEGSKKKVRAEVGVGRIRIPAMILGHLGPFWLLIYLATTKAAAEADRKCEGMETGKRGKWAIFST